MIKLSIIIVNYNVRQYLKDLIHSIRKAVKNISSELIVVDNHSVDGSIHMLKNTFPEVILIENETNTGFASAANTGIKKSSGEYILLINPDTVVNEDTFEKMIEFFENNPDCGLAGCKILNPDRSIQLACRRSFPTPTSALFKLIGLSKLFPKNKIFGKYNLSYLPEDEKAEIDAVSGSFMMFRKKIIDDIGLLDEKYFMYGEDLDFCYRIKKKGWKICYNPKASILHYKGKSTEKGNLNQIKNFYKAMDIFVNTHYKTKLFSPYFYIVRLGIFFRAVVSILKRVVLNLKEPLADFILINLSFLTAVVLRFGGLISLPIFHNYWSYVLIMTVISLIYFGFLLFGGVYDKRSDSIFRISLLTLFAFFTISGLTFFFNQFAFSRLVIFYSGIILLVLIAGRRYIADKIRESTDKEKKKYIVVAHSDEIQNLDKQLDIKDGFTGFVVFKNGNTKFTTKNPILGKLDDVLEIVNKNNVCNIIFTGNTILFNKSISKIITLSSIYVNFYSMLKEKCHILEVRKVQKLGELNLVPIELKICHLYNKFLKRLSDIIISTSLITISFLPFIITYILRGLKTKKVKIKNLYDGYFILKKIFKNDTEYTGYFRNYFKYLCVLKGKMSIVGDRILPYGNRNDLLYKPGIVNYLSKSKTKEDIKDEKTLFYLKNYSFLLDLKIVLNIRLN